MTIACTQDRELQRVVTAKPIHQSIDHLSGNPDFGLAVPPSQVKSSCANYASPCSSIWIFSIDSAALTVLLLGISGLWQFGEIDRNYEIMLGPRVGMNI